MSAAFEFLRKIENEKRQDSLVEDSDESASKITFNRSANIRRNLRHHTDEDDSSNEKPKLKGSKLIMPEYVVGQKIKPAETKKSKKVVKDSRKVLNLSHLMEDDEIE